MSNLRKGCTVDPGLTDQYQVSSLDAPSPHRFKGVSKAAQEWSKKHPNPYAFNNNRNRKNNHAAPTS